MENFQISKGHILNGKNFNSSTLENPIFGIINFLNNMEEYVTTSSCAGRAMLLSESFPSQKKRKKDWELLFTTKDVFDPELLARKADPSCGDLVFKFDPFVLHVMCASMGAANKLLKVAIGAGFHESGITIGAQDRIMLAIRNGLRLEVPISEDSVMLVSEFYLSFLGRKANEKFQRNSLKIKHFLIILKEYFDGAKNIQPIRS